jgi:hypothetical protein
MHSALWGGLAARTATAAVDPFLVICHSGGNTDTAPDQAPASPAPSHACDHCNLCGSTSSPAAPSDVVVLQRVQDRPSHALKPVSTISRAGLEVTLKGARGPPVFA